MGTPLPTHHGIPPPRPAASPLGIALTVSILDPPSLASELSGLSGWLRYLARPAGVLDGPSVRRRVSSPSSQVVGKSGTTMKRM